MGEDSLGDPPWGETIVGESFTSEHLVDDMSFILGGALFASRQGATHTLGEVPFAP